MSISIGPSKNIDIKLCPSLFQHRTPTLYFDYPCKFPSRKQKFIMKQIDEKENLLYKASWVRRCIRDVFHPAQLSLCGDNKSDDWICAWTNHLPEETIRDLKYYQRVNHFPGTWCIGRKDNLLRSLRRARKYSFKSGRKPQNAFDFHPTTYILPEQYKEWTRATERDRSTTYIMKPKNSSNARRIKVIKPSKRKYIPRTKSCILQKYIEDPYLLKKKKFDIRLYVLVLSYDPLVIYLYNDGLVRFCSKSFTMNNTSRFTHCCNVSVNKKDNSYVAPESNTFSEGHDKWPLRCLWEILSKREGKEVVEQLQQTIKDILVKTIIASEPEVVGKLKGIVKDSRKCFELFGFDVLIDNKLKPWILECNISPSLMSPSTLDYKCKSILLADTLHLVGLVVDFTWEQQIKQKHNSRCFKHNLARNAWRKGKFSHNAIRISDMSTEDWELIYDFEDQYFRRGNYKLIFPSNDCDNFLSFLSIKRFNTCLLCSWILNERDNYLCSLEREKDYQVAQNLLDPLP